MRRRAAIPLILTSALVGACTGDGGDPTSGPCISPDGVGTESLAGALVVATAGSELLLCAGTFQGPFSAVVPVTLRGAGVGETVLIGDPADSGDAAYVIGAEDADSLTLASLTVDAGASDTALGVLVVSMEGTLSDVEVTGARRMGVYSFDAQLTVEDSTVSGGEGFGIVTSPAQDTSVDDRLTLNRVVVDGVSHGGVVVKAAHFQAADLTVRGTLEGIFDGAATPGAAITLYNRGAPIDVSLAGVVAEGNDGVGLRLSEAEGALSDLQISSNALGGIWADEAPQLDIEDGQLLDNGRFGLYLNGPVGGTVQGVEIDGVTGDPNATTGLRIERADGTVISGVGISDVAGPALYVYDGQVEISDVTIDGAIGAGIRLIDAQASVSRGAITGIAPADDSGAAYGIIARVDQADPQELGPLVLADNTVTGGDAAYRVDALDVTSEGDRAIDAAYGFLASAVASATIADFTAEGFTLAGVFLVDTEHSEISGATITGAAEAGEVFSYGIIAQGGAATVNSSAISSVHGAALAIFLGTDEGTPGALTSQDNDLRGNPGNGLLANEGTTLTSTRDQLSGSEGSCLLAVNAEALSVGGATVDGCATGLQLQGVGAVDISDTDISNNRAFGVNVSQSTGEIRGGLIADNDVGVACGGASLAVCDTTFEGNRVDRQGCQELSCAP